MKELDPLISVIIPTYNRANIIAHAIRSVLNQTYKNYEIIVVDDGSTDQTMNEINKFKSNKLKYIKLERNFGAAIARNKGIEVAKGEYISFLDSDDVWLENKLEKQIQLFKKNNNRIGVVYCAFKRIYPDGKKVVINPIDRLDVLSAFLNRVYFITTSTILIEKEVFSKIGNFDENLPSYQDLDLMLRIACSYYFAAVKDVLVIQNILVSNRITNNFDLRAKGYNILIKKHYKLLSSNNKYIGKYYLEMGKLYINSNRYTEGKKYFRKALRANPFYFKNYFYFFSSLFTLNFFKKCLNFSRIIKKLIKINY